ncbi:actin interacting protein 3-domain-containing protein [Scheffersomyces coipomensis]|uniref:actin interacting protein 3-domain-containing protein n=1 Tax=Scheffersomyces coipomensis TaxID=1788519 RepID=UPI00315CB466
MNTIESSVTRLLVSTKHLLESLTQWARQEADDKFVSDAYVKLGNDFRAATRVLHTNGVDVSDIGDVPQALRIILEAALSEAPSQENLDRFLPNIRNIIVTLLQNLKTKQLKAKSLSQESRKATELAPTIEERKPERNESIPTLTSDTVKEPVPSNALSQLQNGNAMQRRASKRFSAYQYAKLTNITPSLPRISSPDQTIEERSIAKDTEVTNEIKHDEEKTRPQKDITSADIFLKIGSKVKKLNIKLPVTFASLRLMFVEKFAYSPGSNPFPEVYIQDNKSGIAYELEDHMLHEVKEGSILSLNEPDAHSAAIEQLQGKISDLNLKIEAMDSNIVSVVKEAIGSIEFPAPIIQTQQETAKNDNPSKSNNTFNSKELIEIQNELRAIKQIQSKAGKTIRSTIGEISKEVSAFQEAGLEVSKSSNRAYMESCHLKLSEESDVLLTKVDDLQDIMEALRKDVAQRGVRVSEKQLRNTYKEIEEANSALKKMSNYITKERSVWKKIWESELDKVCEEQQFFNLQDDLTKDLDEDIKKIEETFDLIEQCSLEQNKQTTYKRNKVVAQLHIPQPGESIHNLKEAVLSEVAILKPDHEGRVEAIEKAERLREKERELMKLTKFQEELGDFVDDNKFKNSGGIEELEKMRQLKDSENLKSSLGIF